MLHLRPPTRQELSAISDLMFRSKAVWGYDQDFMEACRDELTLTHEQLDTSDICIAVDGDMLIGMAQVSIENGQADLAALFVDPDHKGTGAGRILFEWAVTSARKICAENPGFSKMIIDADPFAAPFYRHMGAHDIGSTPSSAIPGRTLPQLAYDLT